MADGCPPDGRWGVNGTESSARSPWGIHMRMLGDLRYRFRACAVLALIACGGKGGGGKAPAVVASVVVSDGGASARLLGLGATLQLTATALDASGSPMAGVSFAWTSDDAAVASVEAATGLVTAGRSGVAGIRASADGTTSPPFQVTVALPVAQVAVSPSAAVIPAGRWAMLGASATDAAGGAVPGVSFLWSSADPAHAAVDAFGIVRASLDASGSGSLGLGPIAVSATDPTSGVSGSAAASVAVYPTWSLATGAAGLTVDVAQNQYVVFYDGDGALSHSVVLDSVALGAGAFTGDSAPLQAALAAGSYTFHCGIHPSMHGTLVVH